MGSTVSSFSFDTELDEMNDTVTAMLCRTHPLPNPPLEGNGTLWALRAIPIVRT